MNFLTDRQKQILAVLAASPAGLTIKELEERVGVSRRTIYREFENLRSALAQEGLEISNEKKKYSLQGDQPALKKLNFSVQKVQGQMTMTVAERENAIAASLLLANEPCKIIQLALDLNVSEATIQNDLDVVEKSLAEYKISLIRKKGVGISVASPESERRQVLIGILLSEINDYDFFRYLHHEQDDPNYFLRLLNRDTLVDVKECLDKSVFSNIKLDSDYQIIEVILAFTVSIMRIDEGYSAELVKPAHDSLRYQGYVFKFMSLYSKIKSVAVSPNDITYLANKVMNCDHRQSVLSYDSDHELEVSVKVKNYVKNVSEQMHWNFQKNPNFVNRLTQHILSLSERRVTPLPNTRIEMLAGLSNRFSDLYQVVKESWIKEFPQSQLTNSEMQLVLLYFANEYTSRKNSQSLSALVICENGIGTSAILGARLKQKFPEIKHIKLSRVSNLAELDLQKYDLILSTLELKGFSRDYLLVSPLLLDDEINHIHSYIKEYEQKFPAEASVNQQPAQNGGSHAVEKLSQFSISTLFCSDLVNGIKVQRLEYNAEDLIAIVQECLAHSDRSLIKNQLSVAKRLLKRIRLAPVGIPNSHLALLHTSSPDITRCSFTIFDLDNEITLAAMDHNEIQVKRILLMLGPEDLSEVEQGVMSSISSMIIMNDSNLRLFANGSQEQVKNAIASQFLGELKRKL